MHECEYVRNVSFIPLACGRLVLPADLARVTDTPEHMKTQIRFIRSLAHFLVLSVNASIHIEISSSIMVWEGKLTPLYVE